MKVIYKRYKKVSEHYLRRLGRYSALLLLALVTTILWPSFSWAQPVVNITVPTSVPTLYTSRPVITLGGTAASAGVGYDITDISWLNQTLTIEYGDTIYSGGPIPYLSWTVTIPLKRGRNAITVTATDDSPASGSDTITVYYYSEVSPSAQPFSLTRMELNFALKKTKQHGIRHLVKSSGGRVTVPRNTTGLKVLADITYNGTGTLRAQWKVDGQILGFVTKQLYSGIRKVTLESPDVPRLPTYDTGRHSVELEILRPSPEFNEPVVYYYVTEQRYAEQLAPLKLISPSVNASVPIPSDHFTAPKFRWQELGGPYVYRFELYPADSVSGVSIFPDYGGTGVRGEKPLISARARSGFYTLSRFDMDKLSRNVHYTWYVQAFDGDKPVAASRHRIVYFSVPAGEEGRIIFEYLNVAETLPGKSFLSGDGPKASHEAVVTAVGKTAGTVFNIRKGRRITIIAGIKNETNRTRTNIRVEFLIDGLVVDASFILFLGQGATADVVGAYEVPDARSHRLEVRAVKETEAGAEMLASIGGYLSNK
jgi:hypothetical protein